MNSFKKTDRLYAVCQEHSKKKNEVPTYLPYLFSEMKPETHKKLI